jgi:pyrroline-5-carboxylate reductase
MAGGLEVLSDSKVSFIGPGVIAEAMVAGLLERAGMDSSQIMMSGPRKNRLAKLKKQYGVHTTSDNRDAAQSADIVVLSVKPQSLDDALADLVETIPEEALLLTIVAGARLDRIAAKVGHAAIVRAMPNTPAQIGEGITVWTATPDVTDQQRTQAKQLLSAFGEEVYVEDEDYLDMATALSGTGPAYVFLFMEAMIDAGVHLGFPRRIAEQLVAKTISGSVKFYEHSPKHPARLRNQVTSPGGTSAAALYYLEKAGIRTAIARAIWAAYERSVELGEGKKRGSAV